MIISIIGQPTAGKTFLLRSIIKSLGSHLDVEPTLLFKCQEHNDILIIGRYPENETFGGTDRLSYSTIKPFRDFIKEQVKSYRHIIYEGDRFSNNLEYVLDNYDAICYTLIVNAEEEKRRHALRNDTQSETWLKGRRTQINNFRKNFDLMNRLNVRDTSNGIEEVKKEIMEIIK
jgi:hypothetical protein|tara:strand:- start:48 stop:569 length:522 start_codon:yes stop_codon:yes gene_type:complete